MAAVTVPTYTGDIPSRTQDQSTFDTNVQDFLDYFAGAETSDVIPKINAAGTQISSDSSSAATSASNALLYQTGAQTAAAQAASSANASLWLVGTTYAEGDTVIDDIDYQAYRSTTAGNLGTQPSSDTSGDWLVVPQHTNLSSDISLSVGSGGDFSTINAALLYIYNNFRPSYSTSGVTVTVNLLAGFVMSEQVVVYNIDLSWVEITGADASTSITRSALTTNIPYYGSVASVNNYPAFAAINGGKLPKISQLFIIDATGTADYRNGISCIGPGSSVYVSPSCGVQSSGTLSVGLLLHSGAIATAINANFDYCYWGVYAYSSRADLQGSNVRYGSSNGITSFNSNINAKESDTSSRTTGFSVLEGGLLNIEAATGTTSITVNTLTANGIIFQ